jgi:DNA-binding NarL/FixJ family response regulator
MTGPPAPIRVVVADDQTAIREALATVLGLADDLDVVATARDGAEAVQAAVREQAQVVLMDLRMPGTDGIEATRILSQSHPEIAVVVLTTFADDESILAALGAGARGYLTKDSGREDITRAIRAAAAGQAVLDRAVQERLIASTLAAATPTAATPTAATPAAATPAARPGPTAAPAELTPRELEVLTLIGQGLPNRAIAEHMFVSEATVKTHINNLFAKADIRDRADAVRRAMAYGLITSP